MTADSACWTPRQHHGITAGLSALAMLLAWVATSRGVGISPDSVAYLSTGINLADSQGLRQLADAPLTVFPPGLPVLAATGEAVGLGAEATLRIVSVLSFGAIVALGSLLIRRVVPHRFVALGAMTVLAASPVLLDVSTMAWSEPPFVVVTLAFLLVLGGVWARHGVTGREVLALAVLCWLAFLLRYAGILLIGVTGLALLLVLRPMDRRALTRTAAFGLLGAVVPIGWMVRNHAADGTYLGPRRGSPDTVWDVAVQMGATFGEWLVPRSELATRHLALLGAAGAVLAAAGLVLGLRARERTDGPGERAQLACCGLFVVLYVAYLTVSTLSTAISLPNSRYLSPVYVPAVAIVAAGLAAWLRRGAPVAARVLTVAAYVLFLSGQLATTINDTGDGRREGIALASDRRMESELAAATARLVATTGPSVVYSNSPSALWTATRLQPIHFAPRDSGVRGLPVEGELEEFTRTVGCSRSTTYLVLSLVADDRVIPLDELREAVQVDRAQVASDGAIFRVTAPKPGDCEPDSRRTTAKR